MKRLFYFLPFVILLIYAGYLGLRAGQIPSETEIINHYAAAYLASAPDGAAATDCAAAPHPDDAIRMVISCTHESGLITTYFVGPRGQTVSEPQGPSA
ncbi:MAG: hypothetical protein AAFQ09_10015 [Pseudomonadota bacterium]